MSKDNEIINYIKTELKEVQLRLKKGKGIWPNSNYVRDEIWASLKGEEVTLKSILYRFDPEFKKSNSGMSGA